MRESKSILIVEGVKVSSAMIRSHLKPREEFNVSIVDSAYEAVNKYLGKEDIDLIITAIQLPDMSGVDFIKKVRVNHKSLPIIIMANDGDRNSIVLALEYKIDAVVKKPVNRDLLLNKIDEILYKDSEDADGAGNKFSKEELKELNELLNAPLNPNLPPQAAALKKKIKAISDDMIKVANNEQIKQKLDDSIWEKTTDCPVCGTQFNTLNYRRKSFPAIKKESDFHEIYEHMNPLILDIWVCPSCYYASKKEDFDSLGQNEKAKIMKDSKTRKELSQGVNFLGMRNNEIGILSYRLAIMCYKQRKATNGFFGSINLKAAWLAREIKNRKEERDFLKNVAAHYEKSLQEGEKISGQLSELGLIYLLGETYRRIGEFDKAGKYFMKIKTDPEAKQEKAIAKMADTQLDLVKTQKAKLKK